VLAAVVMATAMTARAAERVTLANGFVETCDHHENVDGRVRLYLNADATSYIDLPPSEIAGFEPVPDAPRVETPSHENAARPAAKLNAVDLHEILVKAGQVHHLDVDLLASVVKAESGGNPRATSRAGAGGLMQLMPGTAGELGVADRYAPEQNVRGGSAYLDELLTRYHDNLALALAAYNAGPAAVNKYHGVPPYRETRLYVARVIHEFNRRVRARQHAATESAHAAHGQ
jgi:soluble lytic murein transglycosylase-like protein